MSGSSFGHTLRLTTFGESHGPGIGGVLDGCPAGLDLDIAEIQAELDLRKPGAGASASKRKEKDRIQILSGIFDGVSTGTPIAFYIANEDQRSKDYGNLAEVFRPGHADYGYYRKYSGIRDYRGGGRSSGRETAARVAAGAIAAKLLARVCACEILAGCIELGGVAIAEEQIDLGQAIRRPYFAASDSAPPLWDEAVAEARARGDTLGGIVRILARNVPPGLGEPVFDKLEATLAHALMSVGAVRGVELGDGFASARVSGSANNDSLLPPEMLPEDLEPVDYAKAQEPGLTRAAFASNHAGGILGGISTGQDILLNVAVKPIASISQEQDSIDRQGRAVKIQIGGRHDLSAIPRIVPVLRAMCALALADALLAQRRMGCIAQTQKVSA